MKQGRKRVLFLLTWILGISSLLLVAMMTNPILIFIEGKNRFDSLSAAIMIRGEKSSELHEESNVTTTPKFPIRRSYHIWGSSSNQGADFEKILARLNYSWSGVCKVCDSYLPNRLLHNLARLYQPFPVFITLHEQSNNNETIPSLFFSDRIWNEIHGGRGAGAGARFRRALPYLQRALQEQLSEAQHPSLVSALKYFGVLPFYVDYGDYTQCPDPNHRNAELEFQKNQAYMLPYLSIAKSDHCDYSFPMPTYMTYEVAQLGNPPSPSNKKTWVDQMNEWNTTYPWSEKINKAYWRGGIKNERGIFVERANNNNDSAIAMDVAACCRKRQAREPMEFSMKYKAVFDLDGNSWSERFPRLLCYNSAVILVRNSQDDFEEYFTKDLEPNRHFIPASLDNFTQVTKDLMRPESDLFLQSIVRNANQFCRERLIVEEINFDFLSVLDGYYETLNLFDHNPNSSHKEGWLEYWKQVHVQYVGPGLGHGGFTNADGTVVADLSNPPQWQKNRI